MGRRITLIEDSKETQRRFLSSLTQVEEVELQAITVAPFFDSLIEEAIKEFAPDFIIVDLRLMRDVESGFRVLRSLKSSALADVPVVVCSHLISSESGDPNKTRALLLGAIAALPKFPFPSLQDFLNLIEHPDSDPPT